MFYTDAFMQDVLGINSLPNVLYHYTSIETLALILSKQTLRFTRLDGVNDPEEARASDLAGASTLVFASCWTAQERESLAMWRMYTRDMQGVRIALPNNPFVGRNPPVVYEKGGAYQLIDHQISIKRTNNGPGIVTRSISGPNKIYYTNDDVYRNGPCLINEDGRWTVQLHDLGMVKNTYWAFEEEWRYKVLATFSEGFIPGENPAEHPMLGLSRHAVVETAVFVPLDPSSLQDIGVLLGPCVTDAQALIVSALLKEYAARATLARSAISVRHTLR